MPTVLNDNQIPKEIELVLEGLQRDSNTWYEDGNLVLQTDTSLFRVYSGLLAARSSVFKDMLAFPPPPEGNLMLDGCPVVRVYDTAEDLGYFLNAIFDSGYFEPPPTPTQLCIVAGVLRLGTKYDVQFLRRRALQHLAVTFPSTLDAWYQRDKTRTIPPVDNTPFAALQLAREFDLPWIIPSIMYCICSHPLIKSIDGTEWAGAALKLSTEDQKIALLGREKLLAMQNKYSINLSLPPLPSGNQGENGGGVGWSSGEEGECQGDRDCASTRQRIPEMVISWTVACYLDFHREHKDMVEAGLCNHCFAGFVHREKMFAREMWIKLPLIFGLENWASLEKEREKAEE